jgi:bacillopeptidase F
MKGFVRLVVLAPLAAAGCIEQNPAWIMGVATEGGEESSTASTTTTTSSGASTTDMNEDGSGTDDSATSDTESTSGNSSGDSSGDTGLPACPAMLVWNFDTCPDGWTVAKAVPEAASDPSWECGEAVAGPGPDGHPGVWGTNLDGYYLGDESSALISPPIDMSACTSAQMTFEHFWEFEGGGGNNDGGILEVSIDDGRTWMYVSPEIGGYFMGSPLDASYPPVAGQFGYSSAPGAEFFVWTTSQLDLTPFVGNAAVRVRFVLGTDSLVENSGWYIDDVEIAGR